MKKYISVLIIVAVILVGFLMRDEFLSLNFYDTYYLISYFDLSLVLSIVILVFRLIVRIRSRKKD